MLNTYLEEKWPLLCLGIILLCYTVPRPANFYCRKTYNSFGFRPQNNIIDIPTLEGIPAILRRFLVSTNYIWQPLVHKLRKKSLKSSTYYSTCRFSFLVLKDREFSKQKKMQKIFLYRKNKSSVFTTFSSLYRVWFFFETNVKNEFIA